MKRSNFNLSNYAAFKEGFSQASWLAHYLSLIWNKKINEKDITYIDTEVSKNLKTNRYDILALVGGVDYIRVNVEMQNNDYDYLTTRMKDYQSRLMNSESEKKSGYRRHKCKSIWLINFKTNKFKKWYNNYVYYDESSMQRLDNGDDSIIVINLNYIDKSNIMELIEFTYLFTHSYDECKDKEFKFDFTKAGFKLMEKINVKDEALQWQAFEALDYENEQYENARTLAELKEENIQTKKELKDIKRKSEIELKDAKLKVKSLENDKINMLLAMYKNNIEINTISKITNMSVSEIEKILKL